MAGRVTELLARQRAGDDSALHELVAALYGELHRIAARQLRAERPSHTLQPTALVHEAYLKLIGDNSRGFTDRVHFMAVASRVMRQVLVDHARARATQKRDREQTLLVPVDGDAALDRIELLDLDSALESLAEEDQALAQIVELRYFGGMTAEEAAESLGISVHVVRHDLRLAQAWLRRKLSC